MRKLLLSMIVAVTFLPGAARAQVTVNMSRVACADWLAMPPGQSEMFSAWMSGWINQQFGYITVGLSDFAKNVASVKQWCTSYPKESVMAALERTKPISAPSGQVRIDMSLITCSQYLGSDSERQQMVAYWMSGYFRASRNQPVLDFQKLANNRRAVGAYCKKNGRETLMSAIQKSAR